MSRARTCMPLMIVDQPQVLLACVSNISETIAKEYGLVCLRIKYSVCDEEHSFLFVRLTHNLAPLLTPHDNQ